MNDDSNDLLRSAFDAYLTRLNAGELEPIDEYLPYNFEKVQTVQWHLFGGEMVNDELREITNNLNLWQEYLRRWQAWNSVIAHHNENDAWVIRREFLETLASHCLFQPSAIRDTFTFVATNSMHQIRLAADPSYKDYLDGDPTTPGDQPKPLTRRKKENRLYKIISSFPGTEEFWSTLQSLNDTIYQQQTSNYRNRASHAIAPRFEIGEVQMVTRSVVQATEILEQPNGSVQIAPLPGKMAVRYSIGGTPPLNMDEALAINLEQYRKARVCYEKYRGLLVAGVATIPSKNGSLLGSNPPQGINGN